MKRYGHNRITKRLFAILADTEGDEDTLRACIRALALEEMEGFTLRVYQYCEGLNSAYLERTMVDRVNRAWFNGPGPAEQKPRFTSLQIASLFNTSQTHAGTMLKTLYGMGLLGREAVRDEYGHWFEYWVI